MAILMENRRLHEECVRLQASLQQAQSELAHASRVMTLSALTTSLAHEVNQPLAAIAADATAALRWLGRESPNLAEVRESLHGIVAHGRRASAVINGMRGLLRKTASVAARCSINDLIEETLVLVRGRASEDKIVMTTELCRKLPPVTGDSTQLQQVILNLVLNGMDAIKEMAEGPRRLHIRSWHSAQDGVTVAVQDFGAGLAQQTTERMFQPFHTTKADGLGIGLAICHSIIEAHGGRLWATPNEPAGAVFHFAVPVPPGCHE